MRLSARALACMCAHVRCLPRDESRHGVRSLLPNPSKTSMPLSFMSRLSMGNFHGVRTKAQIRPRPEPRPSSVQPGPNPHAGARKGVRASPGELSSPSPSVSHQPRHPPPRRPSRRPPAASTPPPTPAVGAGSCARGSWAGGAGVWGMRSGRHRE